MHANQKNFLRAGQVLSFYTIYAKNAIPFQKNI